jgi:hypothetical protein
VSRKKSVFGIPRESGYECGTFIHTQDTDTVNDAVELVTLSIVIYLIFYPITHIYTMNNPAITNLVISLGGMQGVYKSFHM